MFLAIDAGDRFLIQEWARDGTLPTMQSLLARGLIGETKSVEGLYEGATWPSFYTGVNPARHGFHRLTQIRPGTYEFYRCNPGECIKREPFWNRLSAAGKKVAVLDIPLTGVSKAIHGIQMVEWASHDSVYGFHTWPGELKRDVLNRFGLHPVKSSCDSRGRSPQDFCRFRDDLIDGVRKKCELTIHYMNQVGWDFFAQVFTEGHCAGHQCWHLHDPLHPDYVQEIVSVTGDPIREVYKAIDTAIGTILAHVDKNTIVFILATHRMAHNFGGNFLLEKILEKLGVLKIKHDADLPRERGMIKQMVAAAKGEWRKLPDSMQSTLKPVLFPVYDTARRLVAGKDLYSLSRRVDLEHSRCFLHENGNLVSGIRINLAGREPAGVIEPGEESDDFYRQLREDLLHIVDVDSGKPIVKRVMRTSDLFQGEYIDHLPDLLVEWNEEKVVGSKILNADASCRMQLTSEKIGIVEGEYTYCRTGDHRPEGLFVVVGPGISPGTIGRTVSIMDFAPTFLHLSGITSSDLDGEPISEIPAVT